MHAIQFSGKKERKSFLKCWKPLVRSVATLLAMQQTVAQGSEKAILETSDRGIAIALSGKMIPADKLLSALGEKETTIRNIPGIVFDTGGTGYLGALKFTCTSYHDIEKIVLAARQKVKVGMSISKNPDVGIAMHAMWVKSKTDKLPTKGYFCSAQPSLSTLNLSVKSFEDEMGVSRSPNDTKVAYNNGLFNGGFLMFVTDFE
jgi:hypothetical protein